MDFEILYRTVTFAFLFPLIYIAFPAVLLHLYGLKEEKRGKEEGGGTQ